MSSRVRRVQMKVKRRVSCIIISSSLPWWQEWSSRLQLEKLSTNSMTNARHKLPCLTSLLLLQVTKLLIIRYFNYYGWVVPFLCFRTKPSVILWSAHQLSLLASVKIQEKIYTNNLIRYLRNLDCVTICWSLMTRPLLYVTQHSATSRAWAVILGICSSSEITRAKNLATSLCPTRGV